MNDKKIKYYLISYLIFVILSAVVVFSLFVAIVGKDKQIETMNKDIEKIEYIKDEYEQENIRLKEQLEQKPYIDVIQFASEAYGVDPALVWAITNLETGRFTSNLWINNFNPGGRKDINGDYITFDSATQGLIEQARYIKNRYIDKGLTTPDEIGSEYCPIDDSELCSGWASSVESLMKEYRK